MNLKPLFNKVFLELPVEEKVTKSGIFIPDTVGSEDHIQVKVAAVGPGRLNDKGERIPMAVKPGDTVLVREYNLRKAEVNGKKYLIGDEDDILAVIESGIEDQNEVIRIEENRRRRMNETKEDAGL